jgi:hypothetical protein
MEYPTKDEVKISLLGIKNDNCNEIIFNKLTTDYIDLYNIDSLVNSNKYSYLQLIAYLKDDSLNTAPQMKRWHILYDGVGETSIDGNLHYYFHKDTVNEGEDIIFSCAIHNISQYDMDSLLIKYWIVDNNNKINNLVYKRKRPHPAGDVIIDTIKYNTLGLDGWCTIWIEVNPDNDQPEQYHYNNIAYKKFFVQKDITNPLLDVTFDGIHIINGDIVSANPLIEIKLKDENKFLALNDTSLFRILLKTPDNDNFQKISFNRDDIKWYPAILPNNSFRIEYKPKLLEDGIYELMVEAKDVSNNLSGDNKLQYNIQSNK